MIILISNQPPDVPAPPITRQQYRDLEFLVNEGATMRGASHPDDWDAWDVRIASARAALKTLKRALRK